MLANGQNVAAANVGETITYSILVRNITEASMVADIQLVNNLSHLMGSGITNVRDVIVNGVPRPDAFVFSVLMVNIPSLAAGEEVLVSFQATVASGAAGTSFTSASSLLSGNQQLYFEHVDGSGQVSNRPIRGDVTVKVPGDNGGVAPELSREPDRTDLAAGDTVNWTLRGFHNYTSGRVSDFTVVDIPSRGLNFVSGKTPAFTNSAGITFDIRYTVAGSREWRVHAANLDASQPHYFSLPQPGELYYTNIGFFFGDIPAYFGYGNEVVMSFVVGNDDAGSALLSRFMVRYGNVEREGKGVVGHGLPADYDIPVLLPVAMPLAGDAVPQYSIFGREYALAKSEEDSDVPLVSKVNKITV